jgi:asparagine synthase (glutamine-hydrolysing)
MSVQAGIWNFHGEPVHGEFLLGVSAALRDYAPDGERTFFDQTISMLYMPFHTTSESRLEHQPHLSGGGCVITWDGRLDNREDLITELSYDRKDDKTDVSLVATAFDQWGEKCFTKFIGDWGLSIWDTNRKQLILARDYIGVKHLFYYWKPGRVIWCNHLAPLALCGDKFTLCDEYVAGYLAAWPDGHLTPYREIGSVPPGSFVRIRDGKVTTHTYWTLNTHHRTRYKTDAEYEEHYRNLFTQAVTRRLRTDSPVLADLSGGFDSSSIVCMADDIIARKHSVLPRLDTFSFYDSTEPQDDDLSYLSKVEEKRGKTGFHVDLRSSGGSLSFEYGRFLACPEYWHRAEAKAALEEICGRHGYRVLLSGVGGDDVNGQGLDPRSQMADLILELHPVELAKQLTEWSLLIRTRPWIQLLLQTVLQLMPLFVRTRFTKQANAEPWMNHKFGRKFRICARQLDAIMGAWFIRPIARDAKQNVAALSRQMSCTAPSIIEKRYPYLDQNLLEFLKTIPVEQLLRPGQRRLLMRRALANILPAQILTRKTKAGPARCYSVALEKHWDKVEGLLASPISSRLGYVDRDALYKALHAMKTGYLPDHFLRLLRALSLELWLREADRRSVISTSPQLPVGERAKVAESQV